jgi:siroheme synthase-like protein
MSFAYPVALEVAGRRCVVIGGAGPAEARAMALSDAGALVTVVAANPTEGLAELDRRGLITLVRRPYAEGDLAGAFLAVAATGDGDEHARIFEEAEARRVLLNAVDDVEHCHFAVPSILRRGDLVVAVSTGGRAPAYARRLRQELSRVIGPEHGALVDVLGDVRREMAAERVDDVDFATWARRWREALDHDLISLIRGGRLGEVRTLLRAALAEAEPKEAVA